MCKYLSVSSHQVYTPQTNRQGPSHHIPALCAVCFIKAPLRQPPLCCAWSRKSVAFLDFLYASHYALNLLSLKSFSVELVLCPYIAPCMLSGFLHLQQTPGDFQLCVQNDNKLSQLLVQLPSLLPVQTHAGDSIKTVLRQA